MSTAQERYEGWIPAGMLHDLTDVGEADPLVSEVADNVSGYTLLGIFRPLRFIPIGSCR
jgi:hypothetical protein